MEEIFNKYTAGELLEFLDEKNITKYIEQRTVDVDEEGEVIIGDFLDIELLKQDFIYSVRRYVSVKRGHQLYIHDNKKCKDIMQFRFTEETYENIQETVNSLIESLNDRDVNFVGTVHHCG